VSHGDSLAIYVFFIKSILLGKKEELWRNSNISPCKNIILKKNPLKETKKILQEYYNNSIITNLKFQLHKPKNHLSKILL
jgi:hypothetical protein